MRTSAKPVVYLDLEIQSDLIKLNEAELFLSAHPDYLVVIDEVQYKKTLSAFARAD